MDDSLTSSLFRELRCSFKANCMLRRWERELRSSLSSQYKVKRVNEIRFTLLYKLLQFQLFEKAEIVQFFCLFVVKKTGAN